MSVDGPFVQRGAQAQGASILRELMQQFAVMKQPQPASADPASEKRVELLKEIVRMSFAQDARGARLREAWREVGHGLLAVLREMTDQAPDPEA